MFYQLVILLALVFGANSDSSFQETCELIEQLDCETFADHVTCGTDGVNYPTRCHFSKAHCSDPGIHFLHSGACGSSPTPAGPTEGYSTVVPISTTHKTQGVIQDTYCKAMAAVNCIQDGVGVCAINGHFYPTQCDFEKARCLDRDLVEAHEGNCP